MRLESQAIPVSQPSPSFSEFLTRLRSSANPETTERKRPRLSLGLGGGGGANRSLFGLVNSTLKQAKVENEKNEKGDAVSTKERYIRYVLI